jgi:hypothetical protein
MYTTSKQTIIKYCLYICSFHIIALLVVSSISYVLVLSYEFPLNISGPFVFVHPFNPLSFPSSTIRDPILFPVEKWGNQNG